MVASKWRGSLWEKKILESSANKIKDKTLEDLQKSLIYIRKSSGPKIDPCGTPQFTIFVSELVLAIETNCFLLSR